MSCSAAINPLDTDIQLFEDVCEQVFILQQAAGQVAWISQVRSMRHGLFLRRHYLASRYLQSKWRQNVYDQGNSRSRVANATAAGYRSLDFWYYRSGTPLGEERKGKKGNTEVKLELPKLPALMQYTGRPHGVRDDGHAVIAISYDESRGQVLYQNSWGSEWSKQGRFWLDYSWITDWEATDDF
ncbi:MAG: hypothetical protein L6R41_006192 [Letrouitia leprolyta]|nr:MAG: hypothetical protein L6R41_006192 [Letrouitia leprolyta]